MFYLIVFMLFSMGIFSVGEVCAAVKIPVKIIEAKWGKDKGLIQRDVTNIMNEYIKNNPAKFLPVADRWVFSNQVIGGKSAWQKELFGDKPFPGIKKVLNVKFEIFGVKGSAKVKQGEDLVFPFPKQMAEERIISPGIEKEIPLSLISMVRPRDVVAPKGYEFDSGRAVDIACGCDAKGNPTAFMLGWMDSEGGEKHFQEIKSTTPEGGKAVDKNAFSILMKALDTRIAAGRIGAKIYSYYIDALSTVAWEELSSKDEYGKLIPGFRCISASSKGDLAAVRLDNSEVILYDFNEKIWKKLPGKPAGLKVFKVCLADSKNIYVIGSMLGEKVSIYKYNSEGPDWDEMPATDKVVEFAIAMDGTFIAINDIYEVHIYEGGDKWDRISDEGEKFRGLAVQNKDNIIAIKMDGSVYKFNISTKKFEQLKGSTWKFDEKTGRYYKSDDEDKPVFGFTDVCMNAGGMTFLKTNLGYIFHSNEIGIVITPLISIAQPKPEVVPGVAAPVVDTSKVVKPVVRRTGRTAAIKEGTVNVGAASRTGATRKSAVSKSAVRSTKTAIKRGVPARGATQTGATRKTAVRKGASQTGSSSVRKTATVAVRKTARGAGEARTPVSSARKTPARRTQATTEVEE